MSLLETTTETTTANPSDSSTATQTTATTTQTPVEQTQVTWMIGEGIDGVGDRPDWMPEKFKSMQELAQSYADMEKLNSKTYGAPEAYQLSEQYKDIVSQDGYGLLAQVAKELNFSQATFDGILNSVITAEKAKAEQVAQAQQQAISDMRSQLGNERLTAVTNFINSVGLNDGQLKALRSSVSSIDAFEAVEALMKKVTTATNQAQPVANETTQSLAEVDKRIQEILHSPDYHRTPAKYHQELNDLYDRKRK